MILWFLFGHYINMKFYFDTREQIEGDEAYNEQHYKQALIHYKKGLDILNKIASQRNYKASKPFYDGLAYALSDIITTTTDLILESLDDTSDTNKIRLMWAEIPDFLHEMHTVYEQIKNYNPRNTTAERINQTYIAVAECCEEISDALIDSLRQ